ncbi:stage II sporulation protein E [Gottschalkia purinilytica]|uniref:Stage II sporulation protein E n=1 Tax=Gottschalkia purinilytica TaxID=1503 RepID=A0A0L0W8P0_GOTPU|nr:stage II sporulation protein E [Gottschalkia purinilytica]KNF07817.1 stage II sporulation protein E [Gottschalkia purinilytica]
MINKLGILDANTKNERLRKDIFKNSKEFFSNLKLNSIFIHCIVLLLSRATVMENLTPFGIAFMTAYISKFSAMLSIPLMASIGVISVHGIKSIPYLGTIWFIFATYKVTRKKFENNTIKFALFGVATFIITKSIYILITDYFLYDILVTIFEGIITFTLTYIFSYSISTIKNEYNRVFTNEEIICGAIMLALAISGFNNLSLYGASIKNIVGVVLVILFSYNKGTSVGTTVGITVGVVTAMSNNNLPFVISVYGFGGLVSGLFKDLGKIGSSLGFFIGASIMSFYINGSLESVLKIKETLIGLIIFLLLSKILKAFNSKIIIGVSKSTQIEEAYSNRLKDITHKRLTEISQVFNELSATFQKASDKNVLVEQKDISKFVDTVVNDVCSNCSLCNFCWKADFYITYQDMFDIMNHIELKGNIDIRSLPQNFKKRCTKPDLIANKCNNLFETYKLNYKWENKILESRQLVSQQLEGVSKIIKDLANQIDNDVRFKQDVEGTIYTGLRNLGIDVLEVIVTETDDDDFEIFLDISSTCDRNKIKKISSIVSDLIGIELTSDKFYSNVNYEEEITKLKLVKGNRFGAITKVSRLDEGFNHVSGDSYTFGERQNNYFVALSDGMGMGYKANQESNITISLLEKFLEAGFDKEVALKTINSILVLKSTDEMLATIDMSILDLYRGKTQFIKIGSAPTFIKRKDRVDVINSHSLPVGILKDVDFQVYEEDLDDGDFIITMSDGILDANEFTDDKEKWMSDIILDIDTLNPQKMADKILDAAIDISESSKRDDMTVLVTKIWKRV